MLFDEAIPFFSFDAEMCCSKPIIKMIVNQVNVDYKVIPSGSSRLKSMVVVVAVTECGKR